MEATGSPPPSPKPEPKPADQPKPEPVKQAEAKAEKTSGGPEAKTGENVSDAFQEVQDLNLPILWSEANAHVSVTTIVGWLLTAIANSLGAPFWFDALSKLAHLKTSGRKPEAAS